MITSVVQLQADFKKAVERQPILQKIGEILVTILGLQGTSFEAKTKTFDSLLNKNLLRNPSGKPLTDIIRGEIFVPDASLSSVITVLDGLEEVGGYPVVVKKHCFRYPDHTNRRFCMLKLSVGNGVIAEVQIAPLEAREAYKKSHYFYCLQRHEPDINKQLCYEAERIRIHTEVVNTLNLDRFRQLYPVVLGTQSNYNERKESPAPV